MPNTDIHTSSCLQSTKSYIHIEKTFTRQDKEQLFLYGFDLFFSKFTRESIYRIAKDVGGDFEVDILTGCVTYKFEVERCILSSEISQAHEIVNQTGITLATIHKCNFERSELYLRAPKKWICKFTGSPNTDKIFLT